MLDEATLVFGSLDAIEIKTKTRKPSSSDHQEMSQHKHDAMADLEHDAFEVILGLKVEHGAFEVIFGLKVEQ